MPESVSKSIAKLKVSIFILSFSSVTFSLLMFARSGLDVPMGPMLLALLIIWTAAFSSFLVPERYAQWAALISLLILAFVILIARLGPFITFGSYVALLVVAFKRALKVFRYMTVSSAVSAVLFGTLASLYSFAMLHEKDFIGAFAPEFSYLGLLASDSIMHASVAAMIASFGVPSQGIDGLTPLWYHFGSHYWFGAIIRITGCTAVESYMSGFMIAAVPALYLAILQVSLLYSFRWTHLKIILAILLVVLIADAGWHSHYQSESYVLSLAVLLFFWPILHNFIAASPSTSVAALPWLIAAALASFVLASIKISTSLFWCVLYGYVVLRKCGIRSVSTWLASGLFCCSLLIGNHLFRGYSAGDARSNFSLLPLFRDYGIKPTVVVVFAVSALLGLVMARYRVRDGTSLFVLVKSGRALEIEAVLVALCVAMVPAMILFLEGGAQWYFFAPAMWVSFALIVGTAPLGAVAVAANAGNRQLRRVFGVWHKFIVLLLALIVTNVLSGAVAKLAQPFSEQFRAVVRESTGEPLPFGVGSYVMTNLLSERTVFSKVVRDAIGRTDDFQFAIIVRRGRIGDEKLGVFTPPSNASFWGRQSRCRLGALSIPALTGVPAVLGVAPQNAPCDPGYDLLRWEQARSRSIEDDELCRHAVSKGIDRVMLYLDSGAPSRVRTIDCKKSDSSGFNKEEGLTN